VRRLLLVLVLLHLWWGNLAAQAPPPPAPQQFVTDSEAFLSPAAQARLNKRLAAYQRATGHQVLVWIGGTTGVEPLENYTVRAFAAWKVGRQGLDDGLVLFLFAKDQKVRMEVGYGLEGPMPDLVASRIIREAILPRLKGGDRDGAVAAGADAVLRTLGGEVDAPQQRRDKPPMSTGSYVVLGLVALGFLALFITNPGLAMGLLFSLMSGGRGGGGGGGRDDGFGGGGGRSGGGGASGSW